MDHLKVRTTTGQPRLMSVYDVIKKVYSKNCRQVWSDLARTHPELASRTSLHKFHGQGQRPTPVAPAELVELIVRTVLANARQSSVEKREALATFGYSAAPQLDVHRRFTELEICADLIQAFHSLDPVRQYIVGRYRIDLYLRRVKVAIECDEHGHRKYSSDAEAARESFIVSREGCRFVRFDPYAPGFCILQLIGQIVALLHR